MREPEVRDVQIFGTAWIEFKASHNAIQLLGQLGQFIGIDLHHRTAVGHLADIVVDCCNITGNIRAHRGTLSDIFIGFLNPRGCLGNIIGDLTRGGGLLFNCWLAAVACDIFPGHSTPATPNIQVDISTTANPIPNCVLSFHRFMYYLLAARMVIMLCYSSLSSKIRF